MTKLPIPHIAIEGVVGVGKSTVARLVAAKIGATYLGEKADTHPFLDAFYCDPPRYALETELGFLLIHYHQLFHHRSDRIVADFSIAKDLVFARMSLSGDSLSLFEDLFMQLSKRLAPADRVFVLQLPIPSCLDRIRGRGILREQTITADYLEALEAAYLRNLTELGRKVEILSVPECATPEFVANEVIGRMCKAG